MKPINPITANVAISRDKRHLLITAIIILILFGSTPKTWGTTIVVCKNTSEIYIGADSLVGKGAVPAHTDCKIRQVNQFFIAFAGYPFIEVPSPIRFNIVDLFKESCEITNGPLSAKVQTLTNLIKTTLTPILEFVRVHHRQAFERVFIRDEKIVLSVIIAGVEDNIPAFFTIEYQIISPNDKPVELYQTPINQPRFGIFGEHLAIDKLIEREGNPISCDHVIIQRWITLETIARPDMVGLPIDILRITHNDAKWIQHKTPECKEIQ
jgi:hypothetical protein